MWPEQNDNSLQATPDPGRRLVSLGALGGLFGVAALCRGAVRSAGPGAAAHTEETGLLCSPRNAAGVGLRGEYYEQEGRLGQPWLVRTDGEVGFEALSAMARVATRSARWSGWVKAPLPGAYRFHFDHAEARIVVGAVDFSTHAGSSAPPAKLDMTAGRFYPIRVEVDRIGAPAGAATRLEWTPPHGHRFAVSRAMLFLPMAG